MKIVSWNCAVKFREDYEEIFNKMRTYVGLLVYHELTGEESGNEKQMTFF